MEISDFDYDLPEGCIAKFPLDRRDDSKLLVWRGRGCGTSDGGGEISETIFNNIASELPQGSLLVFNNTRVVRARLVMHRPGAAETPGARVELLCLEPSQPADYERAFAARGRCEWLCMVGNLKKWKSGPIEIPYTYGGTRRKLQAWRAGADGGEVTGVCNASATGGSSGTGGAEQTVRFEWDADLGFGQLLELLGRIPIPPYLGRESGEIDETRYQTVYSRIEGSVAAPTAGLHFTPELMARLTSGSGDNEASTLLSRQTVEFDEVTLHVGAGTFLPVKSENALDHPMHTEHFEVTLGTIENLIERLDRGRVIAVGTTSVRTLESLAVLGWRIAASTNSGNGRDSAAGHNADPEIERVIGQFEVYDIPAEFTGADALRALAGWMRARAMEKIAAATRIMITPAGFRFRIADGIITNFHQPKSTLLLLVAAFLGDGEKNNENPEWRRIYDYALVHGFRFLSYGDSSLLLRE